MPLFCSAGQTYLPIMLMRCRCAAVEQREVVRRAQEAARGELEKCVAAPQTHCKLTHASIHAQPVPLLTKTHSPASGCWPCRFYAAQPAVMHIEKNVLYDDLKRRERESKERAIEAQMLDSMYQVRNQGLTSAAQQARSHSAQAACNWLPHGEGCKQATKTLKQPWQCCCSGRRHTASIRGLL